MKLTSDNVSEIFLDCLYTQEEVDHNDTKGMIVVDGVMGEIGFNPERIEKNKVLIQELLKGLSPDFKQGITFLNMPFNNDGQWGEQKNANELLCLGLAIQELSYPAPRDMWNIMPGGMPYVLYTP